MNTSKLDAFTTAYIECMLWSSNDESNESGGEPLDKNYSISDLHESALKKCIEDCQKFQKENETLLTDAQIDSRRAGFLFWLNRNGHGSGFWDEYSQTTCDKYNEEQEIAIISRDFSKRDNLKNTCNCHYHICQRLSDNCKKYRELYPIVVEENGEKKIYIE